MEMDKITFVIVVVVVIAAKSALSLGHSAVEIAMGIQLSKH